MIFKTMDVGSGTKLEKCPEFTYFGYILEISTEYFKLDYIIITILIWFATISVAPMKIVSLALVFFFVVIHSSKYL